MQPTLRPRFSDILSFSISALGLLGDADMQCEICGKKLETKDVVLCGSCVDFIIWKYGNVEKYLKVRNKALIKTMRGGEP